jgi:hypothetical protein
MYFLTSRIPPLAAFRLSEDLAILAAGQIVQQAAAV